MLHTSAVTPYDELLQLLSDLEIDVFLCRVQRPVTWAETAKAMGVKVTRAYEADRRAKAKLGDKYEHWQYVFRNCRSVDDMINTRY